MRIVNAHLNKKFNKSPNQRRKLNAKNANKIQQYLSIKINKFARNVL